MQPTFLYKPYISPLVYYTQTRNVLCVPFFVLFILLVFFLFFCFVFFFQDNEPATAKLPAKFGQKMLK